MRINKFVAQATGLSRRAADAAVAAGRVAVNGKAAVTGQEVAPDEAVTLDSRAITPAVKTLTLILNKPAGYVVSRDGQGSKTIYDLLPAEYHHLKPVGRLDKDSSGLLLLTNDGDLANQLTHPRYAKTKIYEVDLDRPLTRTDKARIEAGVAVNDYVSRFSIEPRGKSRGARNAAAHDSNLVARDSAYIVRMQEGRNRQIRRTFASLGYEVQKLHRTHFGSYQLEQLQPGKFRLIKK